MNFVAVSDSFLKEFGFKDQGELVGKNYAEICNIKHPMMTQIHVNKLKKQIDEKCEEIKTLKKQAKSDEKAVKRLQIWVIVKDEKRWYNEEDDFPRKRLR